MNKRKNIKCLIVDDEKHARDLLRAMLERYAPEINIIGEASNVADSIQLIESLHPELLFLDIELTDGTGFEVLERLKKNVVPAIFITAFDHYAIKAIKSNAFDYILKPIDYKELIEAIQKFHSLSFGKRFKNSFQNYISNQQQLDPSEGKVAIPGREETLFISLKDIVKCTAEKSYTWIFLQNGKKILSSKNLGEFEKVLPGVESANEFFFFRIHHGTLVNTGFIKKYNIKEGSVHLFNEDVVKISLRRKSSFSKALPLITTLK